MIFKKESLNKTVEEFFFISYPYNPSLAYNEKTTCNFESSSDCVRN